MFLIASVLVLAFGVFAYVILRVGALDEYPLPIFGLLLLSCLLALVQIRTASKRWLKWSSALPILLSAGFVYMVLLLSSYGEDRPLGPAVGQPFPVQTLARATDGRPVPVGRARPPGRLQLVVLFRGFW